MSPYELLASICGSWTYVYVHVVSNFVIGAAYVSIPCAILVYLKGRPEVENRWVFWCFILFILGCGTTHFLHVLTLWWPTLYATWSLWSHVFTAAISIATAAALWPLLPKLLAIPTPREFMTALLERDRAVSDLDRHRNQLAMNQELLLRELNHRVRNNLQIIASTLMMQARTLSDPSGQEALTTAHSRIQAIARVHSEIYSEDVAFGQLNAAPYLNAICDDLGAQFGVEIERDIADVACTVDESVPLGLLVNELVTNAVKHGRRPDALCQVRVELRAMDERTWRLTVCDTGPGVRSDIGQSRSFGMRLIRALSQQLGGELEVSSSDEGACFQLRGLRNATA